MLHALVAYVVLNLALFLFCLWRNRHFTGEPDPERVDGDLASLSSAEWDFVHRHHCNVLRCSEVRYVEGQLPNRSACQECAAAFLQENWERLVGRERARAA